MVCTWMDDCPGHGAIGHLDIDKWIATRTAAKENARLEKAKWQIILD